MQNIFLFSLISLFPLFVSASVLTPCQSGNLTTSIHKDFQMTYPDEDFLRLDNKYLLKDLSQLKNLTCLQYLDATDQGLKGDVSNLKNLINFEVLSLYGNPEVTGDICALSRATKMRSLKFAFDPEVYGNISCLNDLNLETFAMTYTKISGDLSSLSHMRLLKALYINGTNITGDISSLSALTNLEELGISDEAGTSNITGDLASLDNLTKLKKVSLYNTKTTNCQHFTEKHPNIQGGCIKGSQTTLVNPNKEAERRIGKEAHTDIEEKPKGNVNPTSAVPKKDDQVSENQSLKDKEITQKEENLITEKEDDKIVRSQKKQTFFQRGISWLKNFFWNLFR
ncbi:MAG: hypothetical protein PHW72_03245 [Candidatus Pacebacteria bacterium]|nr:hypothetical protein [Candidatus Paceibacterota bacterium]